jgi:hypothetical protein
MCQWVKTLFKPKTPVIPPTPPVTPPAPPIGPAPLAIPYPEEPGNPTQTMDNTDGAATVAAWQMTRAFPPAQLPFWQQITVELSLTCPGVAATYDDEKKIRVHPDYCNPGVIAHEMAHISYFRLSGDMQDSFVAAFDQALTTNPLLKYVYDAKGYLHVSGIEAHADVYRYLGEKMPGSLKGYYPRLF